VNLFRIELANLRIPATPEDSVAPAKQAVAQTSVKGAKIVKHAWSVFARAAARDQHS
jgi:hypothetical protein